MTVDLPLIRNSERSDFKTCPQKWYWRWVEGLVPKLPTMGALWYGTIWHLLWATVYTPPAGADGFTRGITEASEIHALWDELAKDAYTTVSSAPYFDDDKEREYWDAISLGHIMIGTANSSSGILTPATKFSCPSSGLRSWYRMPTGSASG